MGFSLSRLRHHWRHHCRLRQHDSLRANNRTGRCQHSSPMGTWLDRLRAPHGKAVFQTKKDQESKPFLAVLPSPATRSEPGPQPVPA